MKSFQINKLSVSPPFVGCSKTCVVERGGAVSFSVSGAQDAIVMKPHSLLVEERRGMRNRVASFNRKKNYQLEQMHIK